MVATIKFESFGQPASGRVITEGGGYAFAQCRNPYGTHNLVVVDMTTKQAIRHGTAAALLFAFEWCGKHAYRKVARVAAAKGLRWTFEFECPE
mgnify:CR=1 FL=1